MRIIWHKVFLFPCPNPSFVQNEPLQGQKSPSFQGAEDLVLGQITVFPHAAAFGLGLVLERTEFLQGVGRGTLPGLQLAGLA